MFIDRRSPVPALALLISTVGPGLAQETATYAHPGQPISIEAPVDWTAGTWPSDSGVYEVTAPMAPCVPCCGSHRTSRAPPAI